MVEPLAHYTEIAWRYCRDVIDRKIPAAQSVRQACQRQLDDLESDEPFVYDVNAAERVCRFIELLPHVKGEWSGQSIKLEPWQIFILTTVFGWKNEHGNRRFKWSYIEVPRKNAKSTLSSGVALYLLAADGEAGAEVYSAATTRDQARIVFNDAKRMVEQTRGLRDRFGVRTSAHSIFVEESGSMFKALSRDQGGNLDGLNIHGAIIDELHAHKTRDVFDVIETATGARAQPLVWCITTAGVNRSGICYEQRTYADRLLKGSVKDEEYFAVIYTVDEEMLDDQGALLSDTGLWQMANPNYGVSVKATDIERKARKARELASAQPNFLTKHLNVWVNADAQWMNMAAWQKAGDPTLEIDAFIGSPCFGGVDLASKIDVAAAIYLFEKDGEYYCFDRNWLPEETIENATNSQYQGWEIDGHLIATPGNVIDYDVIESTLIADNERYGFTEFGYDPFQATHMSTHLLEKGIQMVEVRATVANFSEPMKELEKLILEGKLHHTGSPVMEWMISNVVCHTDAKDNIYPRKQFPENKIDGAVALIIALQRALFHFHEPSVYEIRGLRTL